MIVGGVVLGGCATEATESGASEADVTSLSVTLDGALAEKTLTAADRPRLKAGATEALACNQRFEAEGRIRITCTRGSEQLEVFVRDGSGLLVHKLRGQDRRSFFACTISGNGPDGLPKKLACATTPLRERPTHGGGLVSPFESTVDGIAIPNAHAVGGNPLLLRSMAPGTPEDFDSLFAEKVGAVLVFKNATTSGHDVGEEIATLHERGLAEEQVAHVPFQWKDIREFKAPCEQVIAGLSFIEKNVSAGTKTLFHCTVGEDRTGFLAAMHRLRAKEVDAQNAWDGEMCEHGYGAGNPLKPSFVVGQLEAGLKPLYRKMAYLAAKGQLDELDASVCATDPSEAADFEAVAPPADRLICGTSTLFVP